MDVNQLRKDLRNGPNHVFNDHSNCSTYFCKVAAASHKETLIPTQLPPSGSAQTTPQSSPSGSAQTTPQSSPSSSLQSSPSGSAHQSSPSHDSLSHSATPDSLDSTIDNIINSERELFSAEEEAREGDSTTNLSELSDDLYFRIQRAGDRLVSNAASLVTNSTSNLAECFMGIRCKFDGGKVFNRIQRGSFQYRSYGAGLRFQLGPEWTSQTWKHVTGEDPGEITSTHYEARANIHNKDMKRKGESTYKERRKKTRYCTNK